MNFLLQLGGIVRLACIFFVIGYVESGTDLHSNDGSQHTCSTASRDGSESCNDESFEVIEECKLRAGNRLFYDKLSQHCVQLLSEEFRQKKLRSVGLDNNNVTESEDLLCGLYMAESTVPNAGFGMFSGKDINVGERVGHAVVKFVFADYDVHLRARGFFKQHPQAEKYQYDAKDDVGHILFENYFWEVPNHLMKFEIDHEGEYSSVLQPSHGMLSNCRFEMANVELQRGIMDGAGFHRAKHPGAGAISYLHGDQWIADRKIAAGDELFVDYGDSWFKSRGISVKQDVYTYHEKADQILERFSLRRGQTLSNISFALLSDFWDLSIDGVAKHFAPWLPDLLNVSIEDVDEARNFGSARFLDHTSQRRISWLEENGRCLDNIRPGTSTNPMAGRGAFASRNLGKGSFVTSSPLVHIRRSDVVMYMNDPKKEETSKEIYGHQLLQNYCYGHPNSTLLLFPYSPVTNMINHDSDRANAELQWSSLNKFEWMNRSSDDLLTEAYAGLVMDIVATRDIAPGEEIFINYGSEWEQAWTAHTEAYVPTPGSENYISAYEMNDASVPIRTLEEQENNPYPRNVFTVCVHNDFNDTWHLLPCKISDRYGPITTVKERRNAVYTALLKVGSDSIALVKNITRVEICFANRPHTTDQFLPNAFRHEIHIPDNLFPAVWMDKKS